MRALVTTLVLLGVGCDDGAPPLDAPPADIKVITYSMYYGLPPELVPENVSLASAGATGRAILDAMTLTDYQCRIDGAAQVIVAEQPDVIGLQGALLFAFSRDVEHPNNQVLVDFATELRKAIKNAGGPEYQVFVRDNAVVQDSLPLFGAVRIIDRSAILVNPRFPAKLAGSLTFQDLAPASDFVPGATGSVPRGALHVQVSFKSGATIDLFDTHLQSGDEAAVRAAQAQELASFVQSSSAPDSTVIVTGNLNDGPMSAAYMALDANLVDTFAAVGTPPGFTAFQSATLDNPNDQTTMRLDFIFARSGAVEESRVIFNSPVAPCNLWTSNHLGVVSRVRTDATPPQSRLSE
jgi:endonuclease/exonuclease/phosphatase family metal-dependent hydrolase